MMDLISKLQTLSRKRDMRAICNEFLPLARRSTPLTQQEKDAIINKRGVYRTLVRYQNKHLIDSIIEDLFRR